MEQYIEVGVTARRDPKTGLFGVPVPLYVRASDAPITDTEELSADITKLLALKFKQYIDEREKARKKHEQKAKRKAERKSRRRGAEAALIESPCGSRDARREGERPDAAGAGDEKVRYLLAGD